MSHEAVIANLQSARADCEMTSKGLLEKIASAEESIARLKRLLAANEALSAEIGSAIAVLGRART